MSGYGQFCPVAKTAEVLCERWMPLVLRELMCGGTRFSEIQRGVPGISPSLLSKRLRQLTAAGVVVRAGSQQSTTYTLTPAGWELYPLIEAMGVWGQRWARSTYAPEELDPSFLMWDLRRMLRPEGLAAGRTVIEFWIRDGPRHKAYYWLVVDDDIDLCMVDPGLDVDLRINVDLRTLTQIWMGDRGIAAAVAGGDLELLGRSELVRSFTGWLGHHPVLGGIAAVEN